MTNLHLFYTTVFAFDTILNNFIPQGVTKKTSILSFLKEIIISAVLTVTLFYRL